MTACAAPPASDQALAIGLAQPIDRLNRAALTTDLPTIRRAARDVIAVYDAATRPPSH